MDKRSRRRRLHILDDDEVDDESVLSKQRKLSEKYEVDDVNDESVLSKQLEKYESVLSKQSETHKFTVLGITSNKDLEYVILNSLKLYSTGFISDYIYVTDNLTYIRYEKTLALSGVKPEYTRFDLNVDYEVFANVLSDASAPIITLPICRMRFSLSDMRTQVGTYVNGLPLLKVRFDSIPQNIQDIKMTICCIDPSVDLKHKTYISDRNIAIKRQLCMEILKARSIHTDYILYTDENTYGLNLLNILNMYNRNRIYSEIADTAKIDIANVLALAGKDATKLALHTSICMEHENSGCIIAFSNENSVRTDNALISKNSNPYKTFVLPKNINNIPNYDLRLQTQLEDVDLNRRMVGVVNVIKLSPFKMLSDSDEIKQHVSFEDAPYPTTDIVLYLKYMRELINIPEIKITQNYGLSKLSKHPIIGLGYISPLPSNLTIGGQAMCTVTEKKEKKIHNAKSTYNYNIYGAAGHLAATSKIGDIGDTGDLLMDTCTIDIGPDRDTQEFNIPSVNNIHIQGGTQKYAKFIAIVYSICNTMAILNDNAIFKNDADLKENVVKDTLAFIRLLLFAYVFNFANDSFNAYWRRLYIYLRDTYTNLNIPEIDIEGRRMACLYTDGKDNKIPSIKFVRHGTIYYKMDVGWVYYEKPVGWDIRAGSQHGGEGDMFKVLNNTLEQLIANLRCWFND